MSVPTNLIPTRITGLPLYTGTGTYGVFPYIIDGRTYQVTFDQLAGVGAVPSTRMINTGNGLQGGGDLAQDLTISVIPHGLGYAQLDFTGVTAATYGTAASVPVLTIDDTGRVTGAVNTPIVLPDYVPTSRTITAGSGLTGGGQLSGNVTLAIDFSNATPQPLGAASAGSGEQAARDDHVHPAVNLTDTSQTQGVLPLGRGGTGLDLSPVVGAVIYSDNDSLQQTTAGNAGQVLISAGGLGAPYWGTVAVGSVTSVDVSGGSTGLSTSGGPVTTSGTITIGGTLNVASGGTGATTAANARVNLSAAKSGANSDITSLSGLSGSISAPTYLQFGNGSATTLAAGRMWYDELTGSLNVGMGGGNITQQVGEELFRYGKASSTISDTNLQLIYKTGVVGASGVITFAPTVAGIAEADLIIGVATEDIAVGDFGRVTTYGVVHGINTTGSAYGETWADGDDIWYNPVTGGLTKTKPVAPNIKLQIGTVINAGPGGSGSFVVNLGYTSQLGGTDSNVQLGTLANNDLLQYYSAGGYWRNVASSSIAIGTATNVAGGAANQILYQTGAGATSFAVAPTVPNTVLQWTGSAFAWAAAGGVVDWAEGVNTTVPNASVPAVYFVPSNAATDVDAVIGPKGAGALLAQVPDGTTVGGNKRGAYAVDWQMQRAFATAVASGDHAVIGGGVGNKAASAYDVVGGGYENTADAAYEGQTIGGGYSNATAGYEATVGGGYSNTAMADNSSVLGGAFNVAYAAYSTVGGGEKNYANGLHSSILGGLAAATRGITGAEAYAAGYFSAFGDAQRAIYVLRASTTNATPAVLTADALTASTSNQVTLPGDASYFYRVHVIARRTDVDGETAAYIFEGAIDRNTNAASTALVGTPVKTILAADTAAWDVSVSADTTNGALAVTVTGEAGKTVRWVAKVETVEVVG